VPLCWILQMVTTTQRHRAFPETQRNARGVMQSWSCHLVSI